ncbi:MAG: dephospho-CoA kinase [Bacteroidota bacterium]|jgi:dephospho-CoA kinase|nr:dephospho-CoA kinase [Bacteroidota bacterium]
MLKIGLTGGIGSGKTTVAQIFKVLDVPVLDADTVAKKLMESDNALIERIKAIFGNNVYHNGRLNRQYLANIVFKDEQKLQTLNAIVHPATIAYAQKWMLQQNAMYVVKEAALFFESGSDTEMDIMVGVTAPIELRINRVMKRDGISREAVLERMKRQMDEQEKMKCCKYVIQNDDSQLLIPQVFQLHNQFISFGKLTM